MVLTKSAVRTIGAAIFLVLIFFAVRFLAAPGAESSPAALSKTYTNPAYGFTLKVPADFSAYPPHGSPGRDETGAPTGQAIVLKNTAGDAVQIVITQDTRDAPSNILTADDIEQQAPYHDLSRAQAIQIAPDITGVTFADTKYQAFGTSTDEVWFAYRGNLYEVMADAKNGALLKSIIATWTFL